MTADIHQVSWAPLMSSFCLLAQMTPHCPLRWSFLDSHPTPRSGPHCWACRQRPGSLRDVLGDPGQLAAPVWASFFSSLTWRNPPGPSAMWPVGPSAIQAPFMPACGLMPPLR